MRLWASLGSVGSLAAIAVAFIVGYDQRPVDERADSILLGRQTFDRTVHLPDGRFFHIDLPTGPVPATGSPMLLLIHGAASSPDDEKTLFGPRVLGQARSAGWLVVYPAGRPNDRGEKTWNAGSCCGHSALNRVDDFAYFQIVFRHIAANFRGDPHSVVLHGLSNGAFMAHRLACEFAGSPEVTIRAIAAYNGGLGHSLGAGCAGRRWTYLGFPLPFVFEWDQAACPLEDWIVDQTTFRCPTDLAVHALLMNSGRDKLIPPAGVVFDVALWGRVVDRIAIPPAHYTEAFYAKANGYDPSHCTISYRRDLGRGDVTECRAYVGKRANVTVCLEENSGHGFTTTEPITLPIILQHWLVGPVTASFDPAAETFTFFLNYLQPAS